MAGDKKTNNTKESREARQKTKDGLARKLDRLSVSISKTIKSNNDNLSDTIRKAMG